MKSIGEEYQSLLEQYGFAERSYRRIEDKVLAILLSIPENFKIGIRGGGEHTKRILELLDGRRNIVAVFDISNDGELQFGIKSMSPEAIPTIELDCIIISSFKYRSEMKKELLASDCHLQIIDIYDELEKAGELPNHSFYFYSSYPVAEFIEQIRRYDECCRVKAADKEKLLEQIIFCALREKDFVLAYRYLEAYINEGYSKSREYKEFIRELESFFDDIRKKILSRTKKDIIVFWLDMLEYEELAELPYIAALSEQGTFFESAYTVTPVTFPTFQTMFSKKLRLDCADYFLTENNCVIHELENQGYHFSLIGIETENFKELGRAEADFELYERYAMSSKKLWRVAEKLCSTDQPLFIVFHEITETHFPYLSPVLRSPIYDMTAYEDDFRSEAVTGQRKLSRLYLDKLLQFYFDLYGSKAIKIIMSDHGFQSDQYVKRYMEEANHIVLNICGEGIPSVRCDRLFSLSDFDQLIRYVLEPDKQNLEGLAPKEEVVLLQDCDFYSKKLVDCVVEKKMESYGIAYRGARGKQDKYVITGDGKEYYFRLPDESTNLIACKEYQDRIQYLRSKAKDLFFDINKDRKFVHSRRLYGHCS